ncbi:alpha/beta hydrolase, partial [Aggregatibacter actinomycetemcomitans]|uniref:alpha/beta hydrolase n=1 Tax=Aggregatibacter actinomycetemcomitans TaxID=714 RepID=UPI00197B2213
VPLGHMGRFATDEELGERVQYRYRLNPEEMQRPFLHQHGKLMTQISDVISENQGEVIETINKQLMVYYPDSPSGDRPMYARNYLQNRYEKLEDTYNGFKALAWIPNVEYYLNLAAAGKDELSDFDLWDKYSRIVGVTWSGSVDPDMDFFLAEMYANESGRRLAGVLKQLIDENIHINIITHSLGARVALSAMNVLGDFDEDYVDKIDNLILWEAAVADNALTDMDNYEAKKAFNPVAMEIFPYAWKVPKHISVLYSQEDGVLDGDKSRRDDEFLGILGGAYPKKYWAIGQSKWAFYDYYKDTEIEQYRSTIHAGRFNTTSYTLKGIQRLPPMPLAQYRKSIRELLEQEAE